MTAKDVAAIGGRAREIAKAYNDAGIEVQMGTRSMFEWDAALWLCFMQAWMEIVRESEVS